MLRELAIGFLMDRGWPAPAWLELPIRVPARVVDALGQADLLRYGAGSMSPYDLHGRAGGVSTMVRAYDVCCPGCGLRIYALDPTRYPMTAGGSILEPITFVPCCGRTFRLISGEWVERKR